MAGGLCLNHSTNTSGGMIHSRVFLSIDVGEALTQGMGRITFLFRFFDTSFKPAVISLFWFAKASCCCFLLLLL